MGKQSCSLGPMSIHPESEIQIFAKEIEELLKKTNNELYYVTI